MRHTNYRHLFFDLDNTLWDFDANSKEVIEELFNEYELEEKCQTPFDAFIRCYYKINDDLWSQYKNNEITKEHLRSHRFHLTMAHFKHVNQNLAIKIENEYIQRSPFRKNLIPGAKEILEILSKKYLLHIITNGFKEVQHIKLRECGIDKYFKEIIISEEIGYNKPSPEIFTFALRKANAVAKESIMIGDDEKADIEGAENKGIQAILFDPKERYQKKPGRLIIRALKELNLILP
jgi:putative hydrolase of the HAD superfamily